MKHLNALSDRILSRFLESGTAAADDCADVIERRTRLCTCGTCQDHRVCTLCVLAGKHCRAWVRCSCPAC